MNRRDVDREAVIILQEAMVSDDFDHAKFLIKSAISTLQASLDSEPIAEPVSFSPLPRDGRALLAGGGSPSGRSYFRTDQCV